MPVAAEACLQDAGVRRGCWRAFAGRGAALCAAPAPFAPPGRGPLKVLCIFVFLEAKEVSSSFTGPFPAPRHERGGKQPVRLTWGHAQLHARLAVRWKLTEVTLLCEG